MGAIAVAAQGKGAITLARRAGTISTRYGFTPRRMEARLETIADVGARYGSGITLPIPARVLERNPSVVDRYVKRGIEFAVHGYYHVDHTLLSEDVLLEQLSRARQVLERNGLSSSGFRAPYLRCNDATLSAVRDSGYLYDTSPAIYWPIDGAQETATYRRALTFYGATPLQERASVPWTEGGVVRIPYSLPDDEAVIERLRLDPSTIARVWLSMFRRSHERGELLALGVHPERVGRCREGMHAVFSAALAARPHVWLARLDEIAEWWRERENASVTAVQEGVGSLRITIRGSKRVTILGRGIGVDGTRAPSGGFVPIPQGSELQINHLPFIGLHPSAPPSLSRFLREQGYVVERTQNA